MSGESGSPVRGARPSVEIGGRHDDTLTGSLMTLLVADSAEGMARCEATFGNWGGPERAGFQHFGRDRLEFGKTLKLTLGNGVLFEGRITAIRGVFPEGGPPQVGVSAEDRLQDLRMSRRTRAFADASFADVLRRIAGDHGLQADADLDGERYALLAQVNQSDLAFLRDLARREDAQLWVEGSRLKAAQRARRRGETVELSWAGSLREFSVSADLAHQRTSLVGTGWSVADKKATRHEAGQSAIQAELNGGKSGGDTLRQAFGARTDTLAHAAPATDAQARAVAEAAFRHLARRFVVGFGVAESKPELRVGARLRIRGVGPLFEGEYTVTDVLLRFDTAAGLRTEFLCDTPAISQS